MPKLDLSPPQEAQEICGQVLDGISVDIREREKEFGLSEMEGLGAALRGKLAQGILIRRMLQTHQEFSILLRQRLFHKPWWRSK